MDVTIKIVHARSIAQIRDFPCFMKIKGNHNHPLDTADILNQLRVSPCTREMFKSYFRQGMTPGQAHRYHLLKMDLSYDLYNQANKSTNPSPKSIQYMWTVWKQSEHGGLNTPSMFNAIRKYAEDNPELILKISHENDQFCVVLVTPFMMRAHRQLKEAGEVVFIDATGCVDQLNTAVTPFLCAGPAGAVPLALVFTSSQDEATLTKGFGMVKEAVGDCAFYGKGAPQYFMTGSSDAERKALAVTWPTSQQFLCIFHILQQVWCWLLDSKHGINKNDRQELMAVVKSLVYAESREAFDEFLEKVQINPIAEKYSNFKCYLTTLIQRREEWAMIAFRAGAVLKGHHTNNYCEATMCFIKDNVLNRCKAYNTAQLVMFMAEIFDCYMRQCLADVALSRRRIKGVIVDSLPLETVEPLGSGMYQVQSESDTKIMFKVDLNIGMCTCIKGNSGAICKHQVACANHQMIVVPQMLLLNSCSRRQLAVLALGEEKFPMESSFKSLKEVQSEKAVEENSEVAFVGNSSHDNCTSSQMETETPDMMLANSITNEHSETEAIISESREAAEALVKISTKCGNADTRSGSKKFIERVTSIKSTNRLNSFLNIMGLSVKKGADRGKIPCQPTSIAKRSPEPQTGSHCDPIQSISVHAEKDVKEDPEASSSEKDEETNRFTEFVDDSIVKTEVFLKEESSSQCDITHQDVPSSSLLNTDAVVKLENDMKEEPESCAVSEEIVPSNVDVDLTKLTGVPSAFPQQIFSRIQNLRQNGLNSKQGTLFLPLLIPNTFPVSVPAPVEDTLLLSPQNSLPLQTSSQLPAQYTFTFPTQIPTHNQKSLPPLLQNTLPVPVTNTSPVPVTNTLPKPVTNTSQVPVINTSPLPVTNTLPVQNTLPVSNTNGLPLQNGLPLLLVRNTLPVSVRYTFASSKQLETAMQVPPVHGQITSQASTQKQQNNNSLQETVSPPVQKLITVSSPIQNYATVPLPEQNFITETSPLQKTELVKSSPAHRPLKVISQKQNYSPISSHSQKTSPALSSLQRALPASSPLQKTSTASSLKQENAPMPSPEQKSTTVLKLPPTTIVTSRQPRETAVLPSPVQKPTATFSPPKTTIATSSLQRATTVSSKQKRVPISLSKQKITQDSGKKRSVEDAIQVLSSHRKPCRYH